MNLHFHWPTEEYFLSNHVGRSDYEDALRVKGWEDRDCCKLMSGPVRTGLNVLLANDEGSFRVLTCRRSFSVAELSVTLRFLEYTKGSKLK